MILLCLKTRSNIKPLLSASPTLLQNYLESKEQIQRTHLQAEFPGDMLQDALAVANFPSKNPCLHIWDWREGQLPDPFLHHDSGSIDRLDRLYSRLAIYIEDYITKATSIYPPRAYLCIPNPNSNVDQLQFRGQPIGTDIVRLDALTHAERKRLFRAFMRYELVSKIHHLEDSLELKVIDSIVALTFKRFNRFESEALRCVQYYMKDLYGAIFAHLADSWLPDIPSETVMETGQQTPDDGLRFPDDVWFSSDTYAEDAFIDKSKTRELVFLGFDLMTRLLSAPRDDRGCPMGLTEWLAKIPWRLQQKVWAGRLRMYMLFDTASCGFERNPRSAEDRSEIGQLLHDSGSMAFYFNLPTLCNYCNLQRRIYRQRAWMLLDSADHYPERSISRHFPTVQQLKKQDWNKVDLDPRRSQKWHNYRKEWCFSAFDYKIQLV